MQAGSDPRIAHDDGRTPLDLVREEEQDECIQLLEVGQIAVLIHVSPFEWPHRFITCITSYTYRLLWVSLAVAVCYIELGLSMMLIMQSTKLLRMLIRLVSQLKRRGAK